MDTRLDQIRIRVAMVQTEVEGMKAENAHRQSCGNSIAYGEDAFQRCNQELANLIEDLKNL